MPEASAHPSVELVGAGGGGDRVGEFRRVDEGRALEPAAGHVVDAHERARVAGDFDAAELRALDVGEADAFGGSAGDVREREAFERLVRVDARAVNEDGHATDADVG